MAFEDNVFVNCPFDTGYYPLLRPILFTVIYLKLKPRIALERADSGEPRIKKIMELIGESKYGIHDLSRIKAINAGEIFRLNMPFELGVDVGCRAFGTEEQKQKYLPGMAKGELIGCFGLTEPDHGSDPAGMETKAVDDGDSYILNGAKMWITNGTIADLAIVWAKLDGKIRGFIVEKSDNGFTAPEMKGKHSLRASITSELVFQDCKIPKDRILPGVKGLRGPFSCLNNARYGISWGALGSAQACFDSAKDYAMSRIQFNHPIASYQLVQNKLSWMLREITKGQLLAYHLGKKKDSGTWIPEHISLAKMNNVDIALEIARVARDIHGANGILDEYPIMRHMANLESVKTYEGTHDIHNLIIGRHITGIQAFTREA